MAYITGICCANHDKNTNTQLLNRYFFIHFKQTKMTAQYSINQKNTFTKINPFLCISVVLCAAHEYFLYDYNLND